MITVNQAGYEASGVKHATASGNAEWKLFTSLDKLVLEGTVRLVNDDNSGEEAGIIDFSSVTGMGRYYFSDDEGNRSPGFYIGKKVYDGVLETAARMYYFQRCGMELEEKYAGKFTHKACHCVKGTMLDDPSRSIDISGGWHDAGDYGRYVTAAAVALGHLLYGFIFAPAPLEGLGLNIPESGEEMPDLLSECRYELDWILKMQEEDGGVHHKATSWHFPEFIMPEEDDLDIVITPVSSLATADLAAVCALASRVYRKYDEAYADKLKKAAFKAADWLERNPGFIYTNPAEVHTGTYEDLCDADERLWAAAELFLAGDEDRQLAVMRQILEIKISTVSLGWADVGGFASMCVLDAGKEVFPEDIYMKLKGRWLDEADRLMNLAASNPYELAMKPYDFIWGSNMVVCCNAMVLCVAHFLTGDDKYLESAGYQLDYIFGRNAMDMSYVTGVGERAFRNPHNRPTVADGIDEPIPGYLSGGPNFRAGDTKANEEKLGGQAPMKWFVDDWMSYCTNEITIYWNSPLIFTLAYIMEKKG